MSIVSTRWVVPVLVPLASALLAGALLTAGTATATDAPIRLAIRPSAGNSEGYVTLHLRPGQTGKLALDLVNAGASPVRARTYAADAYSTINGGFGARLETDPSTGPTTWLDYAPQTFELAPGKTVSRELAVAVPKSTSGGEYTAALVIQNETPVAIEGQDTVLQVVRSAMAVIIDVPGERHPAMSINGVDHAFAVGTSVVGFGVTNGGDVRLRPTAAFELQSASGEAITRVDAPLDSLYASTTTRVELPLDGPLGVGRYRARLILTDQPTTTTADSGWLEFTIGQAATPTGSDPPWLLLLVLVAAVLAATVLLTGRARTRRSASRQ
jgi:hypothetical protein